MTRAPRPLMSGRLVEPLGELRIPLPGGEVVVVTVADEGVTTDHERPCGECGGSGRYPLNTRMGRMWLDCAGCTGGVITREACRCERCDEAQMAIEGEVRT